jgi:hypothetical protein
MTVHDTAAHDAAIADQFTRQAAEFARSAALHHQKALDLLVEAATPQPGDVSLDVACGPGSVACAFARKVRQATGLDATQAMLDEGFLNRSPELRLTFLKEELRVLANAVLDIRLQMLNMTDQEALDLMEKQTFQEKEEATEKLQRAKLSSAQLPTYLAGWRGWLRARDAYRQARGASYRLKDFHDQALAQGAVPLPALERLLIKPTPGGTPSKEF